MRLVTLILLVFSLSFSCFSQGEPGHILLMTGKSLQGSITGKDSMFVYFNEVRKSGKTKSGKLDLERVFSYQGDEGDETVIYVVDTLAGNYFSVDEMRSYIYGEQAAFESYHANWVVFSALPLAGASGYLLSSSIFVFTVPFLYVVGTAIPKVKIRPEKLANPEMLKDPAFVLGYERTARTRRLFKALASGFGAAVIGFTVGQIASQ